ncbi:hypothetical protein [Pseudoalteromonas denitrificans]|jgi:hypothetical protein|uniref:Uncharacterized protein n=1 Tax=Pseudoalteromonas denitrificans DSM 6059 TaxID=1123010 RepID=A0A1I1QZC0_9GAMM|nr:hypothetical protein [Pseudoalteromonas denitrificans]SFD27491.1 hypothetical protein SAMN02745724_04063 [Pseudoalteromonas denitrificans DSM 6059]
MYKLIALFLLTYSIILSANQHVSQSHKLHQEKSAWGTHGMTVFMVQDKVYASHMPLANSMHAHQVIISISLSSENTENLKALTKQYDLLTLEPEPFDLSQLMKGTLTHFAANIYANHFERGGSIKLKDITINIEDILLSQPLTHDQNGDYYLLPVSNSTGLLVHKIAKQPSFDQILSIDFVKNKNVNFMPNMHSMVKTSLETPLIIDTYKNRETRFVITRQIYLEQADFR